MNAMTILIMIGTVYGISAIVTIGKIFEPLRDFTARRSPSFWKYLTSCMQCLPFWVGIFISLLSDPPIVLGSESFPEFLNGFITYIGAGSFFSGTSLLIHTVFLRIKTGISVPPLMEKQE